MPNSLCVSSPLNSRFHQVSKQAGRELRKPGRRGIFCTIIQYSSEQFCKPRVTAWCIPGLLTRSSEYITAGHDTYISPSCLGRNVCRC